MTRNVFSAAFWESIWQDTCGSSVLHATQTHDPDRWRTFYDKVSGIWLDMVGQGQILAEKAVDIFIRQGLVSGGASALDIGCGPGALSVCLASKGIRTTAVDSSPGMIDCLDGRIRQENVTGVTPVLADWQEYHPDTRFDLVVAGFFPQAMNPSGLKRLEFLSAGHCAVILGTGRETFSFQKRLWDRVMEAPRPRTRSHLTCAFNYLLTCNRSPNLIHVSWPIDMNLPEESVRHYYRHYFEIFGKTGTVVTDALQAELAAHVVNGCIPSCGLMDVAVIWWRSPQVSGGDEQR